MTAIFLNDTFYLVDNMGLDEILEIANKEGLNSPKLRAKAVMQLNADFYNSAMIKGVLPNIQRGLFQLGDKYLVKSINSIEDLEYFVGPDGKKYTCNMAYYAGLRDELAVVPVAEENQDKKVETSIEVSAAVAAPENDELEAEKNEKLDEATFLDSFLSKYHRVSSFILDSQLEDVERYMSASKADLDREVKIPFLSDARIIDIIDGDLGSKTIENTVGSSNNMLDSLLTFPVFSAIVARRNLSEKFSMLALEGSDFVRICPVGVDEKGNLFGFVHMVKLTTPIISKMENEIKAELKKQGRKFASLSSSEKYHMFEEKFAEYYAKNSGKMLMASGSRKYVNLVEFINNMASKKYVVPPVYSEEDGMMLWPSHEIVAFDNRGTKTLKEQVEEIYSVKETVAAAPKPRFIQTLVLEDGDDVFDVDNPSKVITFRPTEQVPRKKTGSDALNLTLFESLVTSSARTDNGVLALHNQDGEVVSQIRTRRTSPAPSRSPMKPGVLGSDVLLESITMGGRDPRSAVGFEVIHTANQELGQVRKR